MKSAIILAGGIAATIGFAALWHAPLGAGEALAARAETVARDTIEHYEMSAVSARIERAPLTRNLLLTGPADTFQRSELVRILRQVPGVERVRWDARTHRAEPMSLPLPLLIEAMLLGLVGFALGLLLTYLLELRRRARRWDRYW